MSNNQSYLVLDTKDSTYSTANQNSTYTIDSTSAIACPNCFNTTWVLRRSLRNVSKIYLKSLMLPILFPNVRSSNKSNTITVVNNSTLATYTITLPDRTYTDIASLLTRINTAFLSAFPAINVVFALYTASDTTHCYNNVGVTSSNVTNISVNITSVLAKMLGFTGITSDPLVGTTRIAGALYNLSYDHYVNMTICTTPDHNIENQNGNAVSFHIPVNVSSGTIMFSSSNLSFDSYIQNYKGTVINNISVVITDRFGYSVNSRNAVDYSMCLAFEYYDDEKDVVVY